MLFRISLCFTFQIFFACSFYFHYQQLGFFGMEGNMVTKTLEVLCLTAFTADDRWLMFLGYRLKSLKVGC